MKKLVFLVAICLLPNLVIAEGKWPIFSNQEGAEQNLENLMVIGSNKDKTYPIGKFEYQIAEFNCMELVEAANKDKSKVAEFRPGEVLAEQGTTYNLYVGDELVDGTDTVIERKAASEEEKVEIPLDNVDSTHHIIKNDDEMPLKTGKAKNPAKNGLMGSCNLL